MNNSQKESIVVAAVQAAPVFGNLSATLAKTRELIGQAAKLGADLVALPESWLPGYPAWLDFAPGAALWDNPATKKVYADLVANSVCVPGPATEELSAAAREHGVALVAGIHERIEDGPGRNTLYNTLLTFDAEGKLCNHHRKLVPTYTERLVWGPGDAAGLKAVRVGQVKVGGLICWEHWMPLARQAMHDSGEDIHIASWPACREMHQVASRHYAFEGRCFVAAVGSILRAGDLPAELGLTGEIANEPDKLVLNGGSMIIAPDGDVLAGPVYDQETILTATCDLSRIKAESMTLDVSGHYQRPDVFELKINSKR